MLMISSQQPFLEINSSWQNNEFLKAILLLEALYLCSQHSLVPSNSINDIFGMFNKAEKQIKREQYVNMYVML